MPQFTGSLPKHPARSAIAWYLALIAVGTSVLWMSFSHAPRPKPGIRPISFLDAAFTATSAVCVTGLVVRSTGHDFSLLGQMAILALIQLGGIGIMTVTTYIMFGVGGRVDLRQKMIITQTLGGDPRSDLKWVLRNVVLATLMFEAAGFVVLAIRFLFVPEYSFGEALWQALFHSVSAFCNAGFSLNDNSLEGFRGDPVVNVVVAALIVVGGIGFPVMLDVRRNWHGDWRGRWEGLHLHSKFMLLGTLVLLAVPAAVYLLLEWDNTLEGVPLWQRPMIAAFQSVTCRTAGFNTVPIAELTNASLFVIVLLMMIGAGPCSTAGGFKVSTAMVLFNYAWCAFRGRAKINIFRRTVPLETVHRAVATAAMFVVISAVALCFLLFWEQSSTSHAKSQGLFLDALFEVISALGTVGLSTGMTGQLSTVGRVVVIGLMFAGRLGPISVFVALSRGERRSSIEYSPEEPLIG